MACVYLLTAPSGRQYVGMTRFTAQARFAAHCRLAKFGVDSPIARTIRKYGRDAIKVQTLVIADLDYCADFERRAIVAYGTKVPQGLNVANGGQGAGVFSREMLDARNAAIAAAHRKPEARAATSERMRKIWQGEHRETACAAIQSAMSQEGAKKAMSDAQKRIWGDPAVKAKRAAAISKAFADPETKARLIAGQQRARALRNASPGTIHTLS